MEGGKGMLVIRAILLNIVGNPLFLAVSRSGFPYNKICLILFPNSSSHSIPPPSPLSDYQTKNLLV